MNFVPGETGHPKESWDTRVVAKTRQPPRTRIIVKDLGREVLYFENTGQMVSAMADAAEAHQQLYEKAAILHGNIGVGNIFITSNAAVYSSIRIRNWDCQFVKRYDYDSKPSHGTLQFMSAMLQDTLTPPPLSLADDLESFYHVLTWLALRFTRHQLSTTSLSALIKEIFDEDEYSYHYDRYMGGRGKRRHLSIGDMDDVKFADRELAELLDDLADVLRVRYQSEPSDEQVRAFEDKKVLLAKELERARLSPDAKMPYDELREIFDWVLKSERVGKYRESTERLRTSDWMRDRFRDTARLSGEMLEERVEHKLVEVVRIRRYNRYCLY
ncbi:hypothetical protein VNI00_016802 [Paramarasmius palmivorus]|uniref:Fungal-type protein kinase domain-containing protein n=1 Tax=Paramarasmius palmivorus TaxID=297713 RepID=A0AAW0BBF7_9AGAR